MIYGIRPPTAANVGGLQPNRQQPAAPPLAPDTRIDQRRAPGTIQAPKSPVAPNGTQSNAAAIPTQANMLSSEERVFFAKLGAMGPLTYGRLLTQAQQTPAPAARGGRLDVKV